MDDLKNEGRFDRAKGRIRSVWGRVTDDDIERARGNVENLIGRIKERTGESAETIRAKLGELFGDNPKTGQKTGK